MQATDCNKMIQQTLVQMEKHRKGAVMTTSSRNALPVTVIPTGSISVDAALGVGGFPRGRVVEIFRAGVFRKTTLALQVIAEAQAAGGTAAFIDAEHALDPTYARKLGVDIDNLIVSQPDYGEQALEITNALISSGVVEIVVVDSVAALVPKAELRGRNGGQFHGSARPADVAGTAQNHGGGGADRHLHGFHQPGEGEDRGDVRQSGNDHRRTGVEVLLLGAS